MADIQRDKGFGYRSDGGLICMIRCFKCGRENWAPVIAKGRCAWCGFDPNTQSKHEEHDAK